jgi:hypothetical protein
MKSLTLKMLRIFVFSAFFVFLNLQITAQEINGTVVDRSSQLKLEHVEVLNYTTNSKTYTDAKGTFKIKAQINQILIFNQPGYLPDTLFLTSIKALKRYLIFNNTLLKVVEIKKGAFNPAVEYADVYLKAKAFSLSPNHPFAFYPSRFFSKEGRYARRFKRKLELEKSERSIDLRFNEAAVTAVTPLIGKELDYFMVLYRPELKQLDKLDDEELKFYLMNAYKEYKALPQERKVSPSLRIKQLE